MSHPIRFGLATLLVLGASCQPAPKTETAVLGADTPAIPATLSAADTAAIRAVDVEWARAATAGDADALAALYASDATVLPPMEPMRKGDEARKYWIDVTNGHTGTTELVTTAVDGRGDLAIAVGTYRSMLTPKKAGAKPLPTEQGKYIEVLKKQADGSWKIVYDIWNADAPVTK